MTTRPRKVNVDLLAKAVALAHFTSMHNAERSTGLARSTIRKEMQRLGLTCRRPGNYTLKEQDKVAPMIVP